METVEELRNKKKQAESSLADFQGQLNALNEQYERLQQAKACLEQEQANISSVVPTSEVYISQIEEGSWQGAAYNVLEGSRDYLYTNSTGKLISHVNEQLSQINRRMGELESQAGTVNRTISRLNTDIRRYNRKINRRAE